MMTVHDDPLVAVGGEFREPLGQLTHREEPCRRNAGLGVFVRFAAVEQQKGTGHLRDGGKLREIFQALGHEPGTTLSPKQAEAVRAMMDKMRGKRTKPAAETTGGKEIIPMAEGIDLRALCRREYGAWLADLRRFYRLSDYGKLRYIAAACGA